jgi:hypothetical protein
MDKVQKYNSFNTNTPSSESYRNYLTVLTSNTFVSKPSNVSAKRKWYVNSTNEACITLLLINKIFHLKQKQQTMTTITGNLKAC